MDLQGLTHEQLLALKARLDGLTDVTGRTPFRDRQLHNLTLQPTATDARPLFVWSAEQPRDYRPEPGKLFPALVWNQETGEERTVHSQADRDALGAEWQGVQPASVVINPLDDMQAALDALSPEDRAAVIQSQQDARKSDLTARLAALSPDQLEALLSGQPKTKAGRSRKIA